MIPQPQAQPTDAPRHPLRVFLFTGSGARGPGIPAITALIRSKGATVVTGQELPENLRRENTDVLILPGGAATSQLNALGGKGRNIIRRFIESGGGYVGVCAGAFAGSGCTQHEDFGLRLLPAMFLRHKRPTQDIRGTMILSLDHEAVEWSDQEREIACYYHNGPLFPSFGLPQGVRVLATVKEPVQGVPKMKRRAVIVAGKYGRGNVVLCGPHPEQTEGLQGFTWRMICAAMPDP